MRAAVTGCRRNPGRALRPKAEQPAAEHGPAMKHTTSRMLFSYWDGVRRERSAPDRGEIEPANIRHILADTFMLGRDPGGVQRFRLAGTRCTALFGRDLKDRSFASLWRDDREGGSSLVDIVTADSTGLVASLRGTNEDGTSLDLELVLLPLRYLGRTHERVLGALSPASAPAWLGLSPVVSLETLSVRVIRSERVTPPRPARLDTRERFVVHEGGRR